MHSVGTLSDNYLRGDKIMTTTTYTIELSAAENAALSYVAFSQQDWIDNAVHDRARIAIEEIVQITVQKCLDNNIPIPDSKDKMVELAFSQGWIESAAERQDDVIEI